MFRRSRFLSSYEIVGKSKHIQTYIGHRKINANVSFNIIRLKPDVYKCFQINSRSFWCKYLRIRIRFCLTHTKCLCIDIAVNANEISINITLDDNPWFSPTKRPKRPQKLAYRVTCWDFIASVPKLCAYVEDEHIHFRYQNCAVSVQ